MQFMDSWSHSKLTEFEKCRRRTFLLHVAKVPEPPRELRPGQTEHANDRGSRIHNEAEQFVRSQRADLSVELRSFEREFLHLRRLFGQGVVSLEGNWGFDEDWNTMPWEGEWREYHARGNETVEYRRVDELPKWGKRNEKVWFKNRGYYWHPCWHRSKLDALVFPSKYEAIVIDYKTGKKYGNEVKHGEQVQLYTLDTVMRYPDIEIVTTELWYPDQDEITTMTFTREQALKFRKNFAPRGMAVTTNTEWPANPNIFNCRYCDYGKTEHCKVSAKEQFINKRFIRTHQPHK